jgi:hypothetical protein
MISARDEARLLAGIGDPARYGIEACKLCGRAAVMVGAFLPTDPEYARRIGQPEGKTRVALYGLCGGCYALPKHVRHERVEASLLAGAEANSAAQPEWGNIGVRQ